MIVMVYGVLSQVLRGGEMAETAKGPVEFAMVGSGPVILQLHGGASGYDQTLALSWDLHEAGFTVLTPSRPGQSTQTLASRGSRSPSERTGDAIDPSLTSLD
jgi:hypothetical protein